ncbi:RDD family protein [Nocardioides sediminis]|uniref:RDD family protein n=1 Tax=Nocardioides sediminis TaxID=433648 RepID=UPI000D313F32|nr:RDD family protein [Nocardioides sediminis]
MSNYGNPPSDPYGQQDAPAGQQHPYGQQAYGYDHGQQYGGQAPAPFASWFQRVGAYLIDNLLAMLAYIPAVIGLVILVSSVDTTTDPVTGVTTSEASGGTGLATVLIVLGAILVLAFTLWNIVFRQGRTGYTIGKGIMGIKLISLETGQPVGAGMSFVRQIAHILDSIPCNIGYLWPLWDAKRQTFADKIMNTGVIQQPKG